MDIVIYALKQNWSLFSRYHTIYRTAWRQRYCSISWEIRNHHVAAPTKSLTVFLQIHNLPIPFLSWGGIQYTLSSLLRHTYITIKIITTMRVHPRISELSNKHWTDRTIKIHWYPSGPITSTPEIESTPVTLTPAATTLQGPVSSGHDRNTSSMRLFKHKQIPSVQVTIGKHLSRLYTYSISINLDTSPDQDYTYSHTNTTPKIYL